ncbi:uncharacterized protein LOC144877331 [Branchiostoma floridae x Branchiostoma japonicum]
MNFTRSLREQLSCPNGYSYLAHTHLCYRADVSESTYDQALTTCQADGGTLAMPRDNTTNDFLIALKNDANPNVWFFFGLDIRDGSWNYVDGGELSYTDWGDGEPNNAGGAEQCAQYFPGNYSDNHKLRNKWNDGNCLGGIGSICEVGANVALGKTAFQTSNREPASVAVDGNIATNYDAGSCTHTVGDYGEDNPTWWVDLGQSYVIDRLVIFNRQDCCSERLNPFNIYIGDSDQVSTNPRCGGDHQIDVNQPSISVSCQGMKGRYVGVSLPGSSRILTLCEVQVFSVIYGLTIATNDTDSSGTTDSLTLEIFSDVCDDVCVTTTVSGLTAVGTEYNRAFAASSFGDPSRLRLTISGGDWLKLDWIDVYSGYTGLYYRFSCPSNGCQLSTDSSEGSEQLNLYVGFVDENECQLDPSARQDCGWGGITPAECQERGCCFDSSFQDAPWCFYSTAFPGYTERNGTWYKVFAENMTYDAAAQTCASDGGRLAIVKSQDLQDFLVGMIAEVNAGTDYWIGLLQMTGGWTWSDGTAVYSGFTDWAPGEPNNVDEQCGQLWQAQGFNWDDTNCDYEKPFVCQIATDAVIGLWPLNGHYGASDITGNGNDGTATGTQLAPGPYGDADGAFLFSGTENSYIDIPNNGRLDVRYSFTILAHIYPTGEGGPIFDYVGNNNAWGVHFWQAAPQELFMK